MISLIWETFSAYHHFREVLVRNRVNSMLAFCVPGPMCAHTDLFEGIGPCDYGSWKPRVWWGRLEAGSSGKSCSSSLLGLVGNCFCPGESAFCSVRSWTDCMSCTHTGRGNLLYSESSWIGNLIPSILTEAPRLEQIPGYSSQDGRYSQPSNPPPKRGQFGLSIHGTDHQILGVRSF